MELLTERELPAGFAKSAISEAGLIVPEALSREREVWTRDEWKLIDRVIKLLRGRNLVLTVTCPDPRCGGTPVEFVEEAGGGFRWRCSHKDRVFYRAI